MTCPVSANSLSRTLSCSSTPHGNSTFSLLSVSIIPSPYQHYHLSHTHAHMLSIIARRVRSSQFYEVVDDIYTISFFSSANSPPRPSILLLFTCNHNCIALCSAIQLAIRPAKQVEMRVSECGLKYADSIHHRHVDSALLAISRTLFAVPILYKLPFQVGVCLGLSVPISTSLSLSAIGEQQINGNYYDSLVASTLRQSFLVFAQQTRSVRPFDGHAATTSSPP